VGGNSQVTLVPALNNSLLLALLCAWAARALPAQNDNGTLQAGKKVYNYWCVTCPGPGLPGMAALQTKIQGFETIAAYRSQGPA